MMHQRMYTVMKVLLAVVLFVATSSLSLASEVKKITKEELRDKLANDGVVVIDVRTGRDWKSSEFKIKGALRYEGDIVTWASSYSKDTPLVLYCA